MDLRDLQLLIDMGKDLEDAFLDFLEVGSREQLIEWEIFDQNVVLVD